MNIPLAIEMSKVFQNQPIEKAWLFGSFARNEETFASDIDILVEFSKNAKITLFVLGGIVCDLEEATGRNIDLVQNGTLKPFAVESANRDKILIYERKN